MINTYRCSTVFFFQNFSTFYKTSTEVFIKIKILKATKTFQKSKKNHSYYGDINKYSHCYIFVYCQQRYTTLRGYCP